MREAAVTSVRLPKRDSKEETERWRKEHIDSAVPSADEVAVTVAGAIALPGRRDSTPKAKPRRGCDGQVQSACFGIGNQRRRAIYAIM